MIRSSLKCVMSEGNFLLLSSCLCTLKHPGRGEVLFSGHLARGRQMFASAHPVVTLQEGFCVVLCSRCRCNLPV